MLDVSPPTVMRAVRRHQEAGEAGLVHRRADNGRRKLDDDSLAALLAVLGDRARDHGWPRLTWTRVLLALTLALRTGTEDQ